MVSSAFQRRTGVLMVLLIVAAGSEAQSPRPPRPLVDDIMRTSNLSGPQKRSVSAWADYWVSQLKEGGDDSSRVKLARKKLLQPLRPINMNVNNPTVGFRLTYAETLLPKLEKLITEGDSFVAVNAISVMQELGTDQSLRSLLELLESPQLHIRLRAALGCGTMLQAATSVPPRINLNRRWIGSTVRDLRKAAKREKNHLVLRHLFTAIAAVNTPEARRELIEAIDTVVKRMAADPIAPNQQVEAVHIAVLKLRETFINVKFTAKKRRQLGVNLGPVLGEFLTLMRTHWDDSHQDRSAQKMYGAAIQDCEKLLRIIDTEVSGSGNAPDGNLRVAWDNQQKTPFHNGVGKWTAILKKSPYKNPR